MRPVMFWMTLMRHAEAKPKHPVTVLDDSKKGDPGTSPGDKVTGSIVAIRHSG